MSKNYRECNFSNWLEIFYTAESVPLRPSTPTCETMGQRDWDRYQEVIYIVKHLLPPVEREVILLCMMQGKRQRHVAKMLGISQEMVAYNLKRAVFRIRVWIRHRTIDVQRMRELIGKWLTKKQVMAVMSYLSCHDQDAVGKMYGVSQAAISSRLTISYNTLRRAVRTPWVGDDRQELRLYLQIFRDLMNQNSLISIQEKKVTDRSGVVSNDDPMRTRG